jgi:hypothetical protein
MESFKNFQINEAMDAKKIKSAVAKAKRKGGDVKVTFTHAKTGKSVTGQYKGMANRGGRSFVKAEMGTEMIMVPLPDVKSVG